MSTNKKLSILTIILSLICMTLIAILLAVPRNNEIREALDSCIEEVSTSCKGLFEYAATLEAENSRLNREAKRCLQK